MWLQFCEALSPLTQNSVYFLSKKDPVKPSLSSVQKLLINNTQTPGYVRLNLFLHDLQDLFLTQL